MTSDARQYGGKSSRRQKLQVRVTSETLKDSVFWLAKMALYVMA